MYADRAEKVQRARLWFPVEMSGIEPTVARVLAKAGEKLLGKAGKARARRRLRADAQTLAPTHVARLLLAELDEAQAHRLREYLISPDFEEIALQYMLGTILQDVPREQLRTDIRYEIYHGLRHVALIERQLLTAAADVVFSALTAAAEPLRVEFSSLNPSAIATSAHLAAAAAANSRLLREVEDLASFHDFAEHMRAQVVAVHARMRLPHLGVSRAAPYEQLYVAPSLRPQQERQPVPDLSELALPGHRSVILGDPGAGKSTLAAKLAHDVAADRVPGAEGRVPFLLVLREFAVAFRQKRVGLALYLEQVCRAPYNLEPPRHAVEYLLRNGRAVVLLDGLDELVDPELRRRFVQLVDGFVSRFPLVPVLVTARRIGYSEAPLDHRMFTVGVVAELNDKQVTQYAERWFALDDSTAEADRARMAASFLRESTSIGDLRANPLLLALLCAMYSSEHYIPTNLAQVYERCAVMLFDRWDVMRGVAEAPQFVGRLRGAVQHLAWHMFRAEPSGEPLPLHRIVRLLVDHLQAKKFEEDDAVSTAEEFVEFCTGRAWILSDVGATETEPRFGFTHRTFMEYFAAEHLVRTHPTPAELWGRLRPHVLAGEWEVVAQIALQLLERNMDGGVDSLLRLILDEAEGTDHMSARLRTFAARTLGYVHPRHDTVRNVTTAALRSTLALQITDRFHYWVNFELYEGMSAHDEALHTLMYQCSPGNLPVVRRTVLTVLGEQIEAGNETAHFVCLHLSRRLLDAEPRTVELWLETRSELRTRYGKEMDAWKRTTPWLSFYGEDDPTHLITTFGVGPLYVSDYFLTGSVPAIVERLVITPAKPDAPSALCAALLTTPRPWISEGRWWREFATRDPEREFSYKRMIEEENWRQLTLLKALLFLPYLETRAATQVELPLPRVPLLRQLTTARVQHAPHPELRRSLTQLSFPTDACDFLISWTRGEFDLIQPPD